MLPDDVDWAYFQAAPPDQRLAEIPDRAWILLDGLHPEQASLRMCLPQLRVSARLYFADAADKPIELRADRLSIDGSAQLCTLTWRGSFPLSHVAQLAEVVVVAAGVHAPGQALAWPVLPERPRPAKAPPAQWAEAPGSSPSPAPSVVLVPGSRPGARARVDLGATVTSSPGVALRAVMPFREAWKAPPPGLGTTALGVCGGEPPRIHAPFPLAAAGSTTPAQELPGGALGRHAGAVGSAASGGCGRDERHGHAAEQDERLAGRRRALERASAAERGTADGHRAFASADGHTA